MFELEIKCSIYRLIKGKTKCKIPCSSVDMVTSIYQTIRCHIPEDCNLNVYHNVTSDFYLLFAVPGSWCSRLFDFNGLMKFTCYEPEDGFSIE